MIIEPGATDVTVYVYFVDDDGGTAPGEPTTGLLFSDIETGGSASYVRQGAARTDFTLVTLASASAAHADGGFILVDDTNMPGLYRLDLPDAAVATGVDFVIIQLVAAGANNTLMRPLIIELAPPVNVDRWNGTDVAAPTVAGVPEVDLTHIVGGLVPTPATTGIPDVNVREWLDTAVTLSGSLPDVNVEAMDAGSIASGVIAAAELTNIENEIWDALKSAHTVANSFGDFLDIEVSSRATPAQVNTEVLDVMDTDTLTLPGQAAPSNTPTAFDALAWLYKAFRNRKRQTSTIWELMDDAETTVDSKATVSDDGSVAIKHEVVSGP